MKAAVAHASLVLLCLSFGAAIGAGLYESIVLAPLWSRSPPASFSILQPVTGVPLQRFWIPLHTAITLALVLALVTTWRDRHVRRVLLVALAAYIVMRAWSFAFFIPEMFAFQRIPLDAPPSAELAARVSRWTFWTWFRAPLDVISFLASVAALRSQRR